MADITVSHIIEKSDGNRISIGSYIEKDSTVLISIRTNGIDEVLKVTVDGKEVEFYSAGGNYYRYKFINQWYI